MTNIQKIETFRGTFHRGHTDDDARRVLKTVSKLLGLHLVIIWAFRDMWGCGGDSEIAVLGPKGRFYDCPSEISDFLYGGEGEAALLFHLARGKALKGSLPVRIDEHNYAMKDDPDTELS